MCGIAGVFSAASDPHLGPIAARMSAQLGHRGPDGDGAFTCTSGQMVLQHRRLAIIDLVSGDQPMHDSQSGRYTTVLNGEIYNHLQLRREAESRGYRFRTNSDTEVILAGYAQSGLRAINALRGMFAFALWDSVERTLLLARDRFGEKPLFYARDGERFYFASEIKAILAAIASPVDGVALTQYLTLGYIPGLRTAYRNIRRLAPGQMLQIRADGSTAVQQYWELPLPDDRASSRADADWTSAIHDRLAEAVRLRLMADVPLGAFLSGGLDSSTVVALAVAHAQSPFHTFSIRPLGAPSSDADAAREVAAILGTRHHDEVLECPPPNELVELLSHFDEPFADSSSIPTAAVSRAARGAVTVALSGDGADEMFGGYAQYHTFKSLDALAAQPLLRATGTLAAQFWPAAAPGGASMAVVRAAAAQRYLILASQPWGAATTVLADASPEALAQARSELAELFRYPAGAISPGPVARAQWIDASRAYLAGDILQKVDLASMACGLEVRTPYLDHLLAEDLVQLPAHLRTRGRLGKVLLRQIASRYLPPRIINRKKIGFTIPLEQWLAGPLASLVDDYLRDSHSPATNILDLDVVRHLLEHPARSGLDRARLTFALLSLAVWAARGQQYATKAA